ncbi:MAG: ABC transporter permease [Bacteroidia bacterium]|nr:ABC transporter permease [Bacteroidia bacterium]NNM15068.1 ABC transporter permease [Bacteroidia bacterium]
MKTLYELGRYWIFIKNLFIKPEKFGVYFKQVVLEMTLIGYSSLGIVALVSIFMGAVITIQTAYNLVSPAITDDTIALVTRDTIIIEFSPTIIMLVLAGKVGSSIASELGTMRVTQQIDALEIMGINSSGYLVLPKIVAAIFILPFVVVISMFLGIGGGWFAGTMSGVISTADYIVGIQDEFIPFNVLFALTKTVVFAYIITSVSAYHGYYTDGGSLEVGKSSTKGVVYSSILILIMDYVLTQLMLA